MTAPTHPGFHIAPFSADGSCCGVGFWKNSDLSPRWIAAANDFLAANGPVFRKNWDGVLGDYETHLTSAQSCALATFLAKGRIVVSTLLLSGLQPQAEAELQVLFASSMQRLPTVPASTSVLEGIRRITDRPLSIVFITADPQVSDQENDIVRELSTHFAAAFFNRISTDVN